MDKIFEETMIPEQARTIIDLAQVKKGEKVLILCDYTTSNIGKMLAAQVHQMDALPILTVIPPLKGHGAPVPDPIAEMGMRVDVIIAPMASNIAHCSLRTEALNSGVRFMVLPGINEEVLTSGLFDMDFHKARVKCEKMADLLGKAKVAKATTSKGTNITMSLEGREGQSQSGFAVKGVLAGPPSMEALCCPIEGTAEGRIVCDMSIMSLPPELDFKDKLLSEPVEIIVHEGTATEIKGGREARQFKEWLESLNDSTVYTIAELGVGMNPNIKTFNGTVTDESVVGSIHIGIGENWCFPGGSLKSPVHIDFMISNVTLELDGTPVLKEGKLLI